MTNENKRKFVTENIQHLSEHDVSELYDKLWLTVFNIDRCVRCNTSRDVNCGGYPLYGFNGQLAVFPDVEDVHQARVRVTLAVVEHYGYPLLCQIHAEMDTYRWSRVTPALKFTIHRGEHDVRRLLNTLDYVIDGTVPKDYAAINEFIDANSVDRGLDGCTAWSGDYRGVALKGFKNGRTDATLVDDKQVERLAKVVELANLQFHSDDRKRTVRL